MSITVLKHIKGSDIPDSWKEKFKIDPNETFRVTIEQESGLDEEEMPPEEMLSNGLVESVKQSDEDLKAGRFTRCRTKEESDDFFKKAW
ncbi:MAG: hypothetical protein ACE5G9_13120, partial [Nitrospinales bacterium]